VVKEPMMDDGRKQIAYLAAESNIHVDHPSFS
jgi:hypothetical protein